MLGWQEVVAYIQPIQVWIHRVSKELRAIALEVLGYRFVRQPKVLLQLCDFVE